MACEVPGALSPPGAFGNSYRGAGGTDALAASKDRSQPHRDTEMGICKQVSQDCGRVNCEKYTGRKETKECRAVWC